MKLSNCLVSGCILLLVLIEIVQPTCVLESDFGFKINCAFKKSGLFRVRNLGGVKAHASIGFSLGDELGFEQSLTNLDPSRRRSVNVKNGAPVNFVETSARPAVKQEKRGKQNRIMMRPMAPATRPNQATLDKLSSLHRRVSTMQPIVVEPHPTLPQSHPTLTQAKPMSMNVPAFKPLPPKEETLKVLPLASKQSSPLPQPKGPGLAYQSENYPHASHDQISKMLSQMTIHNPLRITPAPIFTNTPKIFIPTTVHPFVPMPVVAPPTQTISFIPSMPSIYENRPLQNTNSLSNFIDPAPHQIHELASQYAYNTKKVDDYNSITGYGDDTVLKFNKDDINEKIAEIAKAGNISMDAVEAAIALRQQQLLSKYANFAVPEASSTTTTTSTTSSTTEAPFFFQPEPEPEIVVVPAPSKPKNRNPTTGKVMNAPREYYPVGYEKNFDDHFQSKVDLPDTTFHCGDQKYFPGLYGDENLGCMVFHVCALTDDGLVMKSFLCPESTLFDQTILKCNWWFYVDCKNTRKLYDTNIPVSKSYQLMKALTFFSSYKKEMQESATTNPEEDSGIKQAISILENQDNRPVQTDSAPNALHVVTPHPIVDERANNHRENYSSPVYRGNRNFNVSKTSVRRTTSKPKIQEHTTGFKLVNLRSKEETNNTSSENTSAANSAETTTEKKEAVTEKRHRRRMTLKNSTSGSSSTVKYSTVPSTTKTYDFFAESTTIQPIIKPTAANALVEIIKQEIQPIENLTEVAQVKLTDHIDDLRPIDHTILENAANLPQAKRFYRSSAEKNDDKEIEIVNNEKVQVIRPTSTATLVGEYASPTATIARLDKAVLGNNRRFKKSVISIVTPINHRDRKRT